jgi:hypothetical protein
MNRNPLCAITCLRMPPTLEHEFLRFKSSKEAYQTTKDIRFNANSGKSLRNEPKNQAATTETGIYRNGKLLCVLSCEKGFMSVGVRLQRRLQV